MTMPRTLLLGAFAVAMMTLSSCYFYHDTSGGTWSYCADTGFCEEAGFCSQDSDCPDGFECDDRASCVPEGTSGCSADADCPTGSFCQNGTCTSSDTCTTTTDCGPGFECDDRGTCVPTPCESDDECLEGSYCDTDANQCVESETCSANSADCPDGFRCDFSRGTCVPGDPGDPSCQGEVVCDTIPPACPLGSAPAVVDGCYTGDCISNAECPDGNPCSSNTEDECIAAQGDGSCVGPVYNGTNCTNPQGGACLPNEIGCTCESVQFAFCAGD
jgi:hypothetical protein